MSERALFPLMLTVVRESPEDVSDGVGEGCRTEPVRHFADRDRPDYAFRRRRRKAGGTPPLSSVAASVSTSVSAASGDVLRKKARVRVKDVGAIRARVNLYRLRVEILLRSYDLLDAQLVLADTKAEGISASEVARRLRVYWNVPPGPIGDLTTLVESHGILVIPMEFGNAAVDGLSLYEPNDTLPDDLHEQ